MGDIMQGLAGLDIGRQLIHRSLFAIGEELPHIESFLTLSPIPGFLPWLQRHLESGGDAAWHSEEEPYRQMILERLFLSEADQEAGVPPLCRRSLGPARALPCSCCNPACLSPATGTRAPDTPSCRVDAGVVAIHVSAWMWQRVLALCSAPDAGSAQCAFAAERQLLQPLWVWHDSHL